MHFFQQNKFKKNLKIALVGSGSIATEYCKVINYFDHEVLLLITKNNSQKSEILKNKYGIRKHFFNIEKIIEYKDIIDAIIVATPWDKNNDILLKLIKFRKPILIEKPIIFTTKSFKKFNSLNKNYQKKIHISFNRNFYDFVPIIIKYLKKNKDALIIANLSDTYEKILSKRGNKIKKYLLEYITSHWISFLYMLTKNLNMNLKLNSNLKKQKNLKSFIFSMEKKGVESSKKILINLIPDVPKNLSIEFFLKKNILDYHLLKS